MVQNRCQWPSLWETPQLNMKKHTPKEWDRITEWGRGGPVCRAIITWSRVRGSTRREHIITTPSSPKKRSHEVWQTNKWHSINSSVYAEQLVGPLINILIARLDNQLLERTGVYWKELRKHGLPCFSSSDPALKRGISCHQYWKNKTLPCFSIAGLWSNPHKE